jgi:hypothetical protein
MLKSLRRSVCANVLLLCFCADFLLSCTCMRCFFGDPCLSVHVFQHEFHFRLFLSFLLSSSSSLKSLCRLELGFNVITRIEGVNGLELLEHIDLQNNQLYRLGTRAHTLRMRWVYPWAPSYGVAVILSPFLLLHEMSGEHYR